ncbi:MAG: hypothetical protein AAB383_04025 [Patescibacteria group bacterium]
MDLSQILGGLSGLMLIAAYVLYFKQALKGESKPNPASWAIWMVAGLINAFTYFTVVEGNVWQSFCVSMEAVGVVLVFGYALVKGKFSRVSAVEILCFLMAVGVGIFWQVTSDDRIANLLLQSIYVISFVPTVVGLAAGRGKENPASWSVCVLAYFLSILSLVAGQSGDWIAFVHPVVNGVIGNGLVAFLSFRKK